MKTNTHIKIMLMLMLITGCISNIYAQEIVPLSPRETQNRLNGNLVMAGNSIVGLERDLISNTNFDPDSDYNGNLSNGNSISDYIDIDNDTSTFSSSSADIVTPRPECTEIVYAGLYWSAVYYIERAPARDAFLNVNNTGLAGNYDAQENGFSPGFRAIPLGGITGDLALVRDNAGWPFDGCSPLTNAAEVNGKIAVVIRRECGFTDKVIQAQNAGAIAVIVVNDQGNFTIEMPGANAGITIPAVMVGSGIGFDIANSLFNGNNINATLGVNVTPNPIGDERLTDLPPADARKQGAADFRNIKFKVPGGAYTNVTAQDIIFDGYANTPTNQARDVLDVDGDGDFTEFIASDDVPYVCYADVTGLIDQSNPTGTYTVADMNATIGQTSGRSGATGGWSLVVIYRDPLESSKFISTNDGFVEIQNSSPPIDFTYTGFRSLPKPFDVNVRYGVAGLEGDRGLGSVRGNDGDQLLILNSPEDPMVTPPEFVPLGEDNFDPKQNLDINPTINFFNSSITFNHQYVTAREPASENTLGFDLDLFDLDNDGNILIANDQTDATFRLKTDQDTYRVFLNTFSIEIIEPELRIIKRVFDLDGVTEITNGTVELGDELFYDLEIENVGNEDMLDDPMFPVTITDILPANTNLVGVETASLPPGVTFTTPSPGRIEFDIPPSLVEETDTPIFIRFRAALVNTCEELRDACSDQIQNVAIATFTGEDSRTTRTSNSSSVIGACGNTDGEATNFLVNVPACSSDVPTCGDDLRLIAGGGYDRYTWTGPGITGTYVETDNILDFTEPGFPFTAASGTYRVVKEDTTGRCMTLIDEFEVRNFRTEVNPILSYVNGTTVVEENCTGLRLPQILFCGDQSLLLETGYDSATTNVSWQRLDNPSGSCVLDSSEPCSLLNGNCTDANWVEVENNVNYTVSEAGDYRIVVRFEGGCQLPFFFSVFKNDFQPELSALPIECGADGTVTVTNAPTNFAFSLTSGAPNFNVSHYTNATGVFSIPPGSGGDITVYGIDTTFPGCEYTATINVPTIQPTYAVTTTNPTCVNDDNDSGTGTIQIQVTRGNPEYQYTISGPALNAPIVVPNSTANNGNYTQRDLLPGTYNVEVISNRPRQSPDCIFTQSVTIMDAPDFRAEVRLLSPQTCDADAQVEVVVLAGSGNYEYDDGSGSFGPNNVFSIPGPLNPATEYTFFVSDNSIPSGTPRCIIEAKIDGLSPYEAIVIDDIDVTPPDCPGAGATVRVQVSPPVADRTYTYDLIDTTPTATVIDQIVSTSRDVTFVGVTALDYRIEVSHNDPSNATAPVVCPVLSDEFTVDIPTAITASIELADPLSCEPGAAANATIRVFNITGGSGNYAWSFDATTGFTNFAGSEVSIPTPTATPGNYTIYIANQPMAPATNITCAIDLMQNVPDRLEPDMIVVNNERNGSCIDQTVDVDVSATPALTAAEIAAGVTYQFTINPAPNTGPANFNINTVGGVQTLTLDRDVIHTITVTRSDTQCQINDNYFIDLLDVLQITDAQQSSPETCIDANDGELTFTVGNSTSFNYAISGGPTAVPNGSGTNATPIVIGSLEAGTYTITVTNTTLAGGSPPNCEVSTDVVITEPPVIMFDPPVIAQDCTTNTNTISLNVASVTGGSGAGYTYVLNNSAGTAVGPSRPITATYDNVPNGTGYQIVVTDGTGSCSASGPAFDLNALPGVTIDPAVFTDACLSDMDGIEITINYSGGTGNYSYSITRDGSPVQSTTDNGAATSVVISDPAITQPGDYEITVINGEGCSGTQTWTINDPVTIVAVRTSDFRCDALGMTQPATFELTVDDGYPNYTVTWRNTTTGTSGSVGSAPGPGPVVFNHPADAPGVFEFTVTDNNTCTDTDTEEATNNNNPPAVTAMPVTVNCNGDDGIIRIEANGADAGGYEIRFDTADPTSVFEPFPAAGFIEYVRPAGTYAFEFRDSRGCPYTGFSASVIEPAVVSATLNAETEVTCGPSGDVPGSITIAVAGGDDGGGAVPDASGYTYIVSRNGVVDATITPTFPGPTSDLAFFGGLIFGDYEIIVRDSNNCESVPFMNQVAGPPNGLDLNLSGVVTTCIAGFDLQVEVVAGSGVIGPGNVPGFRLYQVVRNATTGAFEEVLGTRVDLGQAPSPPAPVDTPERIHVYTGLEFGRPYRFLVEDLATGCTYLSDAPFTRDAPNNPAVIIDDQTPETCNDADDGTVTFTVSGYNSPTVPAQNFIWEIYEELATASDPPVETSGAPVPADPAGGPVNIGPVGSLAPGRYYVRVIEQQGTQCPGTSMPFEIEAKDPIVTIGGPTLDVPSCETTTTLTISTTGGIETGGSNTVTEGYRYAVVPGGSPVPGLAAFNVLATPNTISINTDTNGDLITDATDNLTWDVYTTDDNDCLPPHLLTITINPIAGPSFTSFPTAADNVCDDGDFTFTVGATAPTLNPNGNLFYGINDATVATGPANPIVYVEDGLSHQFTVATPGEYRITIQDGNGCTIEDTITIFPPLEITATFDTTPTCADGDGVILSTVTGGSAAANQTYAIVGVNGTTLPVFPATLIAESPANSGRFINVPPGDYDIIVTDSGMGAPAPGCTDNARVTATVPVVPVLSTGGATDMTCNGDIPPTGSITASLTGPADPGATYTYEITAGPELRPAQNNGTFLNLPPNTPADPTYTVVVTYTKGTAVCTDDQTYTINSPSAVVASPDPVIPASCGAGTTVNPAQIPIIIDPTSGTGPNYFVTVTRPDGTIISRIPVSNPPAPPAVAITIDAPIDGDYNFTVFDSNNCSINFGPVNVAPLPRMSNERVRVDVPISCSRAIPPPPITGDETITVFVEGGTGPFDFVETTGTGLSVSGVLLGTNDDPGTATVETGAAFTITSGVGLYSFTITDTATSCTTTVTHRIDEFDNVDIVATQQTEATCFGEDDGRANLTVTDYTGDFSYTIVDVGVSPEVIVYTSTVDLTAPGGPFIIPPLADPGLSVGNYRVDIVEIDLPYCPNSSNIFNIDGPSVPFEAFIEPINTQEGCNPANNIAFQARVEGVDLTDPNITVQYTLVETGAVNITGLFEGLSATQASALPSPPSPAGSIGFTVDAVYTDTSVVPNRVCSAASAVIIVTPPADDVAITPPAGPGSIRCFGETNGSITVMVTGTDGPFTFTIESATRPESPRQPTPTFNNLGPDTYTVRAYDQLGCVDDQVFIIEDVPEVTIDLDPITNVSCGIDTRNVTIIGTTAAAGGITRYVRVNVTDPRNPVEVSQATATFTNIPAGQYVFYVEDANGCRSQNSAPVPVIPISPVMFELDETAAIINCTGETTAVIDITELSGGVGDYEFFVLNGNVSPPVPTPANTFAGPQSATQFRDLGPGTYTYVARSVADANCAFGASFTVVDPILFNPMATPANVSCNGEDDGSIVINAMGGEAPYSFAIDSQPGIFFNDASDGIPNQHTFENLEPGTYMVLAQDAKGCDVVFTEVIIEPNDIMAEIDGDIMPETCFGDSDGAVAITITGGTAPYRTNITNNDTDFVEGQLSYSDLPGGTTTIFIRDANGCRIDISVDIPEGVRLEADLEPILTCPDYDYTDPSNPVLLQEEVYTVRFNVSETTELLGVIYTLVGVNGTPDPADNVSLDREFTVSPGTYEGFMEFQMCRVSIGNVEVAEYMPLQIPAAQATNNPLDPNEYELIIAGGEPGYTTTVTIDGAPREIDENNIFTIRETGDYTITVTDARGCEVFVVVELTYINVRIPNYFRPAGPGNNKPGNPPISEEERLWYPRQILTNFPGGGPGGPGGPGDGPGGGPGSGPGGSDPEIFSNMEVKVFDRYGRMLADFVGFGEGIGWDGTYQGKPLPSGDYWFTVILNDIDNRTFTGHFTLYR